MPELVLIACFGDLSPKLVGMRLRGSSGIVGHVYRSGRAYASSDPARDPDDITDALTLYRAVGLEDVARRTALQLVLLRG